MVGGFDNIFPNLPKKYDINILTLKQKESSHRKRLRIHQSQQYHQIISYHSIIRHAQSHLREQNGFNGRISINMYIYIYIRLYIYTYIYIFRDIK